jgi:hypothetical protein
MRLPLSVGAALIAASFLAAPAPASAAPLAGAIYKDLSAPAGGQSLLVQVQHRHGSRRHGGRVYRGRRHYGGNAGAAAAGAAAGLFLGAIIASEAQRQQAIEYCMRRYRSYDPYSMTYLGYDGLRHPCP